MSKRLAMQIDNAIKARDALRTILGISMSDRYNRPRVTHQARITLDHISILMDMIQWQIDNPPTNTLTAEQTTDLQSVLPVDEGFFSYPYVMNVNDPRCQAYLTECRQKYFAVMQFTLNGSVYVYDTRPASDCAVWITLLTLDEFHTHPSLGATHAYVKARDCVERYPDITIGEVARILEDSFEIQPSIVPRQ
jgi:hypothetical protein